jgi:hypothetical protein
VDVPVHIVEEKPEPLPPPKEIVGGEATTTLTVLDALQPLADVPLTVYVLVNKGVTTAVEVVTLPALELHVYVLAPLAVNVDAPEQMIGGEATTVKVGSGLT